MHSHQYNAVVQAADDKVRAYRREAEMAQAMRKADRRSHMVRVRNAVAHMMHKMADVVAADKPLGAEERAGHAA